MDLTPEPNGGTDWNAVDVTAFGSHSTNYGGDSKPKGLMSANLSLSVKRIHLAL